MIARAPCWLLAASLLPASAAAQEHASSVRLDDFAVPASAATTQIEQVPARSEQPIVQVEPEARDNAGSIANMQVSPGDKGLGSRQLATAGVLAEPNQLTREGQSTAQASPSLSKPGDSRPRRIERLTGRDQCDPQASEPAEGIDCTEILELRADEYNALSAPVLSAEQKLLAEQQERDRSLAKASRDGMLLMTAARGVFTANDRTNQELASLVLDPPAPPPGPAAAPEEEPGSAIDELVEGVVGQILVGPGF